jgi:serine-type D-Ala-D-Ala carboxypeptidase/endopeptidase (penicillin-binding protein 4)
MAVPASEETQPVRQEPPSAPNSAPSTERLTPINRLPGTAARARVTAVPPSPQPATPPAPHTEPPTMPPPSAAPRPGGAPPAGWPPPTAADRPSGQPPAGPGARPQPLPGRAADQQPGAVPYAGPDRGRDQQAGAAPFAGPDRGREQHFGAAPFAGPDRLPERGHDQRPGAAPFAGPDRLPDRGWEQQPGTGPDRLPDRGWEQFAGSAPISGPERPQGLPDRSTGQPSGPLPVRPPLHPGRPTGQSQVPGSGRPDGPPSAFADPADPRRLGRDMHPGDPSWQGRDSRPAGPSGQPERPADPARGPVPPGDRGWSENSAPHPGQSRFADATRPGYPEPPARPADTARARSSGRRRWLVLAACLLALALVGGGVVVVRPAALFGSTAAGTSTAPAAATSEPAPPPVLSAAGSNAPEPSTGAVQAALAGPIADPRLGTHVGVEVIDVASGHQLYSGGATDATIPASTNKLTTATAVLATRGAAYRIPTRVVAGATPGEVVIIGGGDPTLAAGDTPFYPGAAKLSDLAAQVRAALGGATPTKVTVDSSLFVGSQTGPGWQPDDLNTDSARITALMTDGGRSNPTKNNNRSAKPDQAAGVAFAKLLGLPATAVALGSAPPGSQQASPTPPATSPAPASTHAPGQLLGVVYSPPLVRIVETMLSISDNTVAEVLARQVALATGGEASFAGAASAVLKKLADLGIDTAGVNLVDGSGLSNLDRLTPRLLTGLLATAAGSAHPELHGVLTGLPVAGYSGTLADRYRSPGSGADAGIGEVRAKTGTLNGVSTLAGVVIDGSGRLLAFAVLADQVPSGAYKAAEAALDRVAAALAAVK